MTRRRAGGPLDMSKLMGATLGTAKLARGVEKARAILLWPHAVGPEIAKLTKPRSQQGGTLFVEVRDSAAAHHLTMQRHHFIKRLNELMNDRNVTEIRFSVGTVKPPPDAPRSAPLPAPDRARARKLVQDVQDPELKQVALRAAEAITRARKWREEQGWRPCPVCHEPSQEQPCKACLRTLEDPNVKRAARSLIRTPENLPHVADTLGDSGRNAAKYLALAQLADQLDLLAVECVRGGGAAEYVDFLRIQARVYLCLHLEKPISALRKSDLQHLPEKPRQVLTAGRGEQSGQ